MNLLSLAAVILTVWLATATSAPPQHDAALPPVGEEDYELGLTGEEIVETTTVRAARRRLPAGRSKASGAKTEPRQALVTTTTTSTTEKPVKRRPASTATGGSNSRATTTTAKPGAGEEETPVSTYRRPKFPPRRLPAPTQRPPSTEPAPDATLDIAADPTLVAADPGTGPDVVDGPLLEEEFVDEPTR